MNNLKELNAKYKYAIDKKWASESFLKSEWLVEKVMSSSSLFCHFISNLSNLGITNASGSSYSNHCNAVYREGVLLIDYHNINDCCDIKIASNPNAKFIRGDQDSRSYGDPHPKLEGGEWVTVWSNGRLTKDGPWWPKIHEVIQYWIDYAETSSKKNLAEYEEFEKQKIALIDNKETELANNWK
jgi:hypothetical protein